MSGPQQTPQHHHRSTLKQKNKSFKSRHASKGSIKTAAKGRQESVTSRASSHKSSPLSSHNSVGNAQARRNHAKQMQLQKRQALIDANRIFRSANGSTDVNAGTGLGHGLSSSGAKGAPRIVVVCALTQDVDAWSSIASLEQLGEEGGVRAVSGRSCAEARTSGQTFAELDLVRHKTTLQLHPVPYGALYPLLDACKAADFALLVLSPTTSIEAGSWGELAMRSLQAQGLPTLMAGCPSLHSHGGGKKASVKAANEIRRSLLSFTQYFAPDVEKVYSFDDSNECGALLRTLATSTPRRVAWRDFRAWLVSEHAQWTANTESAEQGLLKVVGWIRGASLSANRLIHIPDFGDFEVDRITAERRNDDRRRKNVPAPEVDMDSAEDKLLEQRDSDVADELVSENEVDEMENEQTWPTQEELALGEANAAASANGAALPPAVPGTTPVQITKEGTGRSRRKYGANWIREIDEDEEDEYGHSRMDQSPDEDGTRSEQQEPEADRMDLGTREVEAEDDEYDEEMEAQELAAYKERMTEANQRRKREDIDREFPDEVDTPLEIPARVRFQRYRGLKSMRTSHWDPYEDLPRDYGRIFQFDDYKKTRRRVEASAMEEGVAPGTRVAVYLRNVPRLAAVRARAVADGESGKDTVDALPFVLFGLLRHEHKKSVLNFTVARNTEYEATIKSKDTLILCLGPRRLRVQPIFSQHDPANDGRRGTNNVHKMERFLHGLGTQGYVAIGTVIGPVTFGGANVPAVLLRERILDGESGYDQRGIGATQMPHLVGTGSLLDADPTRIVAKRIVLTGHPYKIHKRTSTIRFMFFNPEDVRYFAPLELRSKLGRVGHITESLGTHGYFKAHFDGKVPLSQLDTVGMTLYKRTFPKFADYFSQSRLEMPLTTIDESDEEDEAQEMVMT